MNRDLISFFTAEEIKWAAFLIKSSGTPGVDGTNGVSLQTYRSVVDDKDAFPQEGNFTQLVLLPKVQNPTKMTELWPISLCLVLYKIVSKVLCARLKRILPNIVSEVQGAFALKRLVSDNIFIAHEMVHT